MYVLYSQRKKDSIGNPEVFIYDEFPKAFRNQFFKIINDVFNKVEMQYHGSKIVEKLCEIFSREKGLKCIPGYYNIQINSISALEIYIDNCSNIVWGTLNYRELL
ncbi:hypothetical protein RBG61_09120 [Paludicola sp. MB14-C6]|uniref:AbiJ-NTD4 domain-containing protein n=1 Tax=Paludihabitans sp. MB14-C6 TaxID=3070656 RepID=UPI0027DBD3D7|nr:hypothetical protein [Paludicola sp. MB14-C6]WMJ22161.1 hypothetical protein RBG61_09120 [Paludicola sp. MB14-C6]